MKFVTPISNKNFNTIVDAIMHILNSVPTEEKMAKFKEELEIANSFRSIDEIESPDYEDTFTVDLHISDIIQKCEPQLYQRMYNDWIDRLIDLFAEKFEFESEMDENIEEFGPVWGKMIKIIV